MRWDPSDFKYLHLHYHLASSREPLGLLIEEPKVGRPQEAVEKAEKNRDVRLSELRAGARAVHLRQMENYLRWKKEIIV